MEKLMLSGGAPSAAVTASIGPMAPIATVSQHLLIRFSLLSFEFALQSIRIQVRRKVTLRVINPIKIAYTSNTREHQEVGGQNRKRLRIKRDLNPATL
jgi:hypothetical protein